MLGAALNALPLVSAGVSALPALMQGRPLEALASGGLGYAGGQLLKGLPGNPAAYGATVPGTGGKTVVGLAGRAGQKLGLQPSQILGLAALGTGATVLPQLARSAGQASAAAARTLTGTPLQTAAGFAGTQPTATDYGAGLSAYDQQALQRAMEMQYGLNPTDVFGPRGMTRTAETQREARAQAEAMRILNTEEAKFLNVAKSKDLERSIAAAVARENIARQSQMLGQAQLGAQDIASRAAAGISQGLMQQYQYS
jgi:hypothetical protein